MRVLSMVLLATLAALAGCATPQHNYAPTTRAVTFPPLDTVQEARIGDDIVRQGATVVQDGIFVPKTMSVSMYTVAAGYFKKIGDSDKGEFFVPGGGPDGGQITQQTIADAPQALMVRRSDGVLCVVTVFDVYDCYRYETGERARVTAGGFERRHRTEPAPGSTIRTLIYNGKADNKIRLAYRESGDGLVPTTNTVEYDLGASPIVEYRGARIEVLQASDQAIKYRVLRNFEPGHAG